MGGIVRALLSVYNKEGIVDLAKALSKSGTEIISSGGTAKLLKKSKIKVVEVSDFTGFPEMMDGRVKTLHPKIHGGILADRTKKTHLEEAKKKGIKLIDMVVVNLYPFEDVINRKDVNFSEAIENIDIGGPTLIRSAAKNFESVIIVSNPKRYGKIEAMISEGKEIDLEKRKELALEAFEHVSHYDSVIERYLRGEFGVKSYPEYLNLTFKKMQDLRYGENAHQTAALYKDERFKDECAIKSQQIQGRELSYNNILDLSAAFELVKNFSEPTAVIVKHNNPCGVATDPNILKAYNKALAVDSEAAFGGIVAINQTIEKELAEAIVSRFYEVVIAPSITLEAKEIFKTKKRLRLMEMGNVKFPMKHTPFKMFRSVPGGLLVQDADRMIYDNEKLKVVSKREPTHQEMKDLLYAWTVCKYVKSNCIVYARDNQAIGIGAGQMKRIDAAKLAAMIAESYGETVKGCAMASDAFFPFRDGIDEAKKVGVTSIIQPGGSIRDQEVIDAVNEHKMSMVFTGIRHFRH